MNQFLICISIALVLLVAYYIYRQKTGEAYGSISGNMSVGKGCMIKPMTYITPDGDIKQIKCWSCNDNIPAGYKSCDSIVRKAGSAYGWEKTGNN